MDFRRHTIGDLSAQVRSRELSARELTVAALDRIERHDPEVRSFVALDGERALETAAMLDERIAAGDDPGPLAGIPVGVKDLEAATGFTTTYGSAFHAEDPAATSDSPLVARLRAAGAVVVGKTATSEWGHSADTVGPLHPGSRMPFDTSLSAGGSSGGSGAALGAGLVPLCTGSDGGGSIRIPSSISGFAGFKSSQGRVPNGGARFPGSGLFSVKGPMARTTADIALALDCVVGPEPTDMFSLPAPQGRWSDGLATGGAPARVLWPTSWVAGIDSDIAAVISQTLDAVADSGTEIIEVGDLFGTDPLMAWFTMWTVNIWRLHEQYWDTPDWNRITPTLQDLMTYGRDVSAGDFARALDDAHAANAHLAGLLEEVPLLLTPTIAGHPGPPGRQGTIDGVETVDWVRFTFPFNVTRHPAGTVCAGIDASGLPVGLQVVGPQHADAEILGAMAHLERLFGPAPVAPGFDD